MAAACAGVMGCVMEGKVALGVLPMVAMLMPSLSVSRPFMQGIMPKMPMEPVMVLASA